VISWRKTQQVYCRSIYVFANGLDVRSGNQDEPGTTRIDDFFGVIQLCFNSMSKCLNDWVIEVSSRSYLLYPRWRRPRS
jgi:hypothetical protein